MFVTKVNKGNPLANDNASTTKRQLDAITKKTKTCHTV